MTPEELARQAEVLVDQLEREQINKINAFLTQIENDFKQLIDALPLDGTEERRAILQLRVQSVLQQSRAAQQLLSMGEADGPLADSIRLGIRQAYEDGLQTAAAAVIDTGVLTPGQVALGQALGPRVDLELIDAITKTTITTLDNVANRTLDRLEEDLVRAAVRGTGPRAAGRAISDNFDVSRREGERIARTVFMAANNDAREASFKQLGVKYLQYNATNDERVCEDCEARHGMVYDVNDAPDVPIHPNCRCVLLPWNADSDPADRGDAYYLETRASMREDREEEGRTGTTATSAAPFERASGVEAPRPVWAPGRGFL